MHVSIFWRLCNQSVVAKRETNFPSLDLLLTFGTSSTVSSVLNGVEDTRDTCVESLIQAISARQETSNIINLPITVVLAPQPGYLCRNDLLRSRTVHAEDVSYVVEFPTPDGGFVAPVASGKGINLSSLLACSPGALVGRQGTKSYDDTFALLHNTLKDRLSFDWILAEKPAAKTVAVVGGRPMFDTKNMSWGSRGPFEAAKALDMSVIVLDAAGHFMEGGKYAQLRDDFIAVDMTINDGLPARLADAVRTRGIDGILTFSDEYVIVTAQAADILGLATEPTEAVLGAHYKDKTRELLANANFGTIKLDNSAQATDKEVLDRIRQLEYPLIVKPCRGAASRGVKKVQDEQALLESINNMERAGLAKYGILIEPYIDGPEVDANFVLWDEKVLFVELTDDFPCAADAAEATAADDFRETIMLCPTALSESEQESIKTSLGESLVKMGFRSGVYHVEARVQHSSKDYTVTDGVFDLVNRATQASTAQPRVFLIEVNVRPPGLDCAYSTLYTCGVDLCALHLLRAVQDGQRFKVLSKPFACHAQYWCGNCQIPVDRQEIVVPEDFCQKLLLRAPEVAPFVSRTEMFKHPGTVVSPVHGVEFLAYFLVYSRESRRHVLQMYQRLLDVAKMELDGQ